MAPNEIPIKVSGDIETSGVERGLQRLSRMARGLAGDFGQVKGALGSIGRAGGFDPSRLSADGQKYREQFTNKDGKLDERDRASTRAERMAAGGLRGYQRAWGAIGETVRNTTNLTARNLTAGGMYNTTALGLSDYKRHLEILDDEARSVKSLTQTYEEYRRTVKAAGSDYGFTNDEVIGLSSQLGHTNGRAGAGRLADEMRTVQGFARGYGMDASEAGGIFAQSTRQGITAQGGEMSPRAFAGLIADAVTQGGMQGRESEVVSSIQGLSATMNNRLVSPQNTQFAAGLLATMNATGVRGLQGEHGASLLAQVDQGIKNPGAGEAGDMFEYRALTGNQGGMRYGAYERLKEQGLGGVNAQTGKSNFQAIMESLQNSGLDDDSKALQARSLLGVSMDQFNGKHGLVSTFFKDGKFDTTKLDGLKGMLGGDLGSVDTSMLPLLSELQAAKGDPSKLAAVGKEFEQLKPGQTAATDFDGLLAQIKGAGPALSEGQQRQKLDADLAKAGEEAGGKLYVLQDAADKAALSLMKITGAAPGPLGGMLPMLAGTAAGGALNMGSGALLKWAQKGTGSLLKGLFGGGEAAAAEGGAAAAAEGSTAAAGSGLLGSLATFGGGLLAGGTAAWGGSAFAQHALGTQSLTDATGVAATNAGQIVSGQSGNGWGDWGNAFGSIAASPFVTSAALLRGGASAATGGSFSDSYNQTFFGGMDMLGLHSTGGDQYHASMQGTPTLPTEMTQQLRDAMQSGRMQVEPITVMVQYPDGRVERQQSQAQVKGDPFAGLIQSPTRSAGN